MIDYIERYIAESNPTGLELAAFQRGFNAGVLSQLVKQAERLAQTFASQPNPDFLSELAVGTPEKAA